MDVVEVNVLLYTSPSFGKSPRHVPNRLRPE